MLLKKTNKRTANFGFVNHNIPVSLSMRPVGVTLQQSMEEKNEKVNSEEGLDFSTDKNVKMNSSKIIEPGALKDLHIEELEMQKERYDLSKNPDKFGSSHIQGRIRFRSPISTGEDVLLLLRELLAIEILIGSEIVKFYPSKVFRLHSKKRYSEYVKKEHINPEHSGEEWYYHFSRNTEENNLGIAARLLAANKTSYQDVHDFIESTPISLVIKRDPIIRILRTKVECGIKAKKYNLDYITLTQEKLTYKLKDFDTVEERQALKDATDVIIKHVEKPSKHSLCFYGESGMRKSSLIKVAALEAQKILKSRKIPLLVLRVGRFDDLRNHAEGIADLDPKFITLIIFDDCRYSHNSTSGRLYDEEDMKTVLGGNEDHSYIPLRNQDIKLGQNIKKIFIGNKKMEEVIEAGIPKWAKRTPFVMLPELISRIWEIEVLRVFTKEGRKGLKIRDTKKEEKIAESMKIRRCVPDGAECICYCRKNIEEETSKRVVSIMRELDYQKEKEEEELDLYNEEESRKIYFKDANHKMTEGEKTAFMEYRIRLKLEAKRIFEKMCLEDSTAAKTITESAEQLSIEKKQDEDKRAEEEKKKNARELLKKTMRERREKAMELAKQNIKNPHLLEKNSGSINDRPKKSKTTKKKTVPPNKPNEN